VVLLLVASLLVSSELIPLKLKPLTTSVLLPVACKVLSAVVKPWTKQTQLLVALVLLASLVLLVQVADSLVVLRAVPQPKDEVVQRPTPHNPAALPGVVV
jgi:hypothetical protein